LKLSKEIKLLLLTDLITVNISTLILFIVKFKCGIFVSYTEHSYSELLIIAPVLYIFWLAVFHIKDLYKSFYFRSAVEIGINSVSGITLGAVILYIITNLNLQELTGKGLIIYYLIMLVFVTSGRVLFKLALNHFLKKVSA
jgi:FlaA1/EpsC-like NDP-sugar epimerase